MPANPQAPKEASDAAKVLQKYRKQVEKVCAYCGKTFPGTTRRDRDRAFCSNAHRVMMFDRENPEKAKARRQKRTKAAKDSALDSH